MNHAELLQNLRASHLVSEDELNQRLGNPAEVSAQTLADSLQAAGLLTAFQLDAIARGRLDELRIGNYEVLDKLGSGGMGTVYKARHRRMKRVVALKVMSRSLSSDANLVQRFQREVETIARLSHPNIVLAYDADEAEVGHFLVMEFVNGRDLASLVQTGGPFPVRNAVSCILQTALGLSYAHEQNIIHRDIKPANLLCDDHGTVKITDLGLARLADSLSSGANSALTQAGGIVGTVDYMPPEQAFDSSQVDHRSDIYSLGCTLYFLLTGGPPYQGGSSMALLLKHREAPIPSLRAARPDSPPELDNLFLKMVAKNPADRYQKLIEVVHALERVPLPQEDPGLPAIPIVPFTSSPTITNLGASRASTHVPVAKDPVLPPGSDQTIAFGAASRNLVPPTVLLVEPSRTQVAIIKQYLKPLGITPEAVGSGAEALAKLRAKRPEAVVSTMHLKDMTGVQLAHQLATEFKSDPINFVLISSTEEQQSVGSLSKFGNMLILPKPFDAEQLTQALHTVTGRDLKPLDASFTGLSDSKRILGLQSGSTQIRTVPKVDRSKLKVLLVDDSATARSHTRSVLQGFGLTQFVEVSDGAQAVASVAREPFDLIVTDYNMPHMDGRSLLGYLRQNAATCSVPVIMVTTEQDLSKLDAVKRLGGVTICEKSCPGDVIRTALDQLFG